METNDKVSVNDSKLGSRPNFWLLAEIMKRGEEGSGVVHVDRKQSDRGPVDPLMKSRRANESREREEGREVLERLRSRNSIRRSFGPAGLCFVAKGFWGFPGANPRPCLRGIFAIDRSIRLIEGTLNGICRTRE